jgi:hypothetical protein
MRYTTIEAMMRPFFADGPLSNDKKISPSNKVRMPIYEPYWGWGTKGYPFRDFLADCYHLLGKDLADTPGIQQLCHHYYLQNGILDAKTTADRIRKFVGEE